jgi:hypothetical protein
MKVIAQAANTESKAAEVFSAVTRWCSSCLALLLINESISADQGYNS